jgi:CBS domain-containing protein
MTRNPITVNQNTTIYDSAKIMKNQKIGSIIVTDDGDLSGIITERDLVRKVLAEGKDSKSLKVTNIMSKPVIHINEDADLLDASELMRKNNIRRLVVINRNKHIVGVLTTNDMAKVMRRAVEELATIYHAMSEDIHIHK